MSCVLWEGKKQWYNTSVFRLLNKPTFSLNLLCTYTSKGMLNPNLLSEVLTIRVGLCT